MSVTLTYLSGDVVTIDSVQEIVLTGPYEVVLRCFGNAAVKHRGVAHIAPAPFTFPNAAHMPPAVRS
jgi:hypothetical protein